MKKESIYQRLMVCVSVNVFSFALFTVRRFSNTPITCNNVYAATAPTLPSFNILFHPDCVINLGTACRVCSVCTCDVLCGIFWIFEDAKRLRKRLVWIFVLLCYAPRFEIIRHERCHVIERRYFVPVDAVQSHPKRSREQFQCLRDVEVGVLYVLPRSVVFYTSFQKGFVVFRFFVLVRQNAECFRNMYERSFGIRTVVLVRVPLKSLR